MARQRPTAVDDVLLNRLPAPPRCPVLFAARAEGEQRTEVLNSLLRLPHESQCLQEPYHEEEDTHHIAEVTRQRQTGARQARPFRDLQALACEPQR